MQFYSVGQQDSISPAWLVLRCVFLSCIMLAAAFNPFIFNERVPEGINYSAADHGKPVTSLEHHLRLLIEGLSQ